MQIKYYTLNEAMDIMSEYSKQNGIDNTEVLRWIVVKTLRLKRDQFNYIKQIDGQKLEDMKCAVKRYSCGESLSKIFGYIEFYGHYFDVTENVFDPRLSTEALVTTILEQDKNWLNQAEIMDLCTGSGCVAITLAKELNKSVDALDISPIAIEIAKKNAEKLNAKINFFEFDLNNDWQSVFNKKYDIIVSNPPYWNAEKILNNVEVTRNNPLIAFDGGEDGLKYIKIIIDNSLQFLNENGMLFLEVDPDQIETITSLLKNKGYKDINIAKDHRGIDRVIYATKK